jgi:hypothetical protein
MQHHKKLLRDLVRGDIFYDGVRYVQLITPINHFLAGSVLELNTGVVIPILGNGEVTMIGHVDLPPERSVSHRLRELATKMENHGGVANPLYLGWANELRVIAQDLDVLAQKAA